MKTIAKLGMALCLTTGLSFGVTMYRGQLMDASCYSGNTHSTAVSSSSSTTTTTPANSADRMNSSSTMSSSNTGNSYASSEKAWVRCAPTASTTDFAIHTNGKIRMLDPAGNTKAETAFQNGDLKRDHNGDMPVVVDGHRHGNTIAVEGIRARGSNISVH